MYENNNRCSTKRGEGTGGGTRNHFDCEGGLDPRPRHRTSSPLNKHLPTAVPAGKGAGRKAI